MPVSRHRKLKKKRDTNKDYRSIGGFMAKVENIPYGSFTNNIIPKGVKLYFFDKDGNYSFFKKLNYNIEIRAINDKNAIRKYNLIKENSES